MSQVPVKYNVDKFLSRYTPVTESGCWLWDGPVNEKGYGRDGQLRAHRIAYELFNGAIPDGMTVDHMCRVRCCINPAHLQLMTHREANIQGGSGNRKFDPITGEQVCIRGHVMKGENVRVRYYKNSTRIFQLACQTCDAMHNESRKKRRLARRLSIGNMVQQ